MLGVPLVRGREISDADTDSSERVAVVNETFVNKLLPNTDPLGHHLGDGKRQITIIGVVKDSKYTRVREKPQPMAYYPYTQSQGVAHLESRIKSVAKDARLLCCRRSSGPCKRWIPTCRLKIHKRSRRCSNGPTEWEQLLARLSSFFGVLAVFLVALGLYGTLAYRVNRRRAEIAVRMALEQRARGCCG